MTNHSQQQLLQLLLGSHALLPVSGNTVRTSSLQQLVRFQQVQNLSCYG